MIELPAWVTKHRMFDVLQELDQLSRLDWWKKAKESMGHNLQEFVEEQNIEFDHIFIIYGNLVHAFGNDVFIIATKQQIDNNTDFCVLSLRTFVNHSFNPSKLNELLENGILVKLTYSEFINILRE
jgi:hypothetical protein